MFLWKLLLGSPTLHVGGLHVTRASTGNMYYHHWRFRGPDSSNSRTPAKKTMRSLAACVGSYLGQRVTAPGGIGGECVDWANLYLVDVCGHSPIRANAVDWPHAAIAGFTWVANSPTNYPSAGDLVVWGEQWAIGVGAFGHIALVLLADRFFLVTTDQNWPDGSPVTAHAHSYLGVRGWFHRS
jgi:hypothetical protein